MGGSGSPEPVVHDNIARAGQQWSFLDGTLTVLFISALTRLCHQFTFDFSCPFLNAAGGQRKQWILAKPGRMERNVGQVFPGDRQSCRDQDMLSLVQRK